MKFAQARLSPPGFGQVAGEAAIDLPDNYFDVTKAEYKARRDLLVKRLNAMNGVYCPKPGGAFYAMAKLPIDDSDKFCQWLLQDFNYKKQTVMLAPATGFYGSADFGKELLLVPPTDFVRGTAFRCTSLHRERRQQRARDRTWEARGIAAG